MANYSNISGVSGLTFSIGLAANMITMTSNGTNLSLDHVLDMATHKIIGVVNPSNPQDAMTLNYANSNYINLSQKGSANGVSTLDANGKIPVAQLPNSVMEYKGAWDATTNFPVLSDAGTATKALKKIQDLTYTAKTAGLAGNQITIAYTATGTKGSEVVTQVGNAISVDIESGVSTASDIKTAVDNFAGIKVDVALVGAGTELETAPVSATNLAGGQDIANNGDVYRVSVEGTQNLGSGNITFYVGDFAIYNGSKWERSPMADGVQSVFGRTGVVEAEAGDYTAADITNVAAGTIEATDVQAAINELDGDVGLKADKVVSATSGHLAGLDSNGNLTDSGIAATSLTGNIQTIAIPIAVLNTVSTYALPNSSIVKNVTLVVESVYNAGTISAAVGAVSILASTDSNILVADQYSNVSIVKIATGAVVTVTVAGSPAFGSAVLYVDIITSTIA